MHASVNVSPLDYLRPSKPIDCEYSNITTRADYDGITHINIDRHARTELGRSLTHIKRMFFMHPELGPFQSVEGFIGYIRSRGTNPAFHHLSGMEARHHSKQQIGDKIEGFRDYVMEANYLKIVQNPELANAFITSTLPFEHYYLFGSMGRAMPPRIAAWLPKCFENLRVLMRENKPFPTQDYSKVLFV